MWPKFMLRDAYLFPCNKYKSQNAESIILFAYCPGGIFFDPISCCFDKPGAFHLLLGYILW
jgi:hypothetical protein